MKKIILLLFIFACQSNPIFPWYKGNLDELKTITGSKLIMIDFYTDTWGWCNRLEADTFLDSEFLALTEKFNSIKINAGERDGSKIAEQYKVRGYPTVIFIDKDGTEIDRLIGYDTPDNYIPLVNDILEAFLTNNPDDNSTLYNIAKKYSDRGEAEKANNFFKQFLENNPTNMEEEITSAEFLLAKAGWDNGDISGLQKFIKDNPNSDNCMSAYQLIARFYTTESDTLMEIQTLKEMTEVFPESSSAMNSYAWRMTELNKNLDEALIIAKKGVELADESSKPMILDTQAEIEWMLKDFQSAISTIKLAINLDPENDYYQAQLEKFKLAN